MEFLRNNLKSNSGAVKLNVYFNNIHYSDIVQSNAFYYSYYK